MKTITAILMAAVTLTGCATARDLTVCTMLAGVANQRGASFNGRIDGRPYKTNINWNADHNDPGFLDPIECTQRLAKIRELQAQQQTMAGDLPTQQ